MARRPLAPRLLLLGLCAVLVACGGAASAPGAHQAAETALWRPYVHSARVLDAAGPRRDGSVVVAAAGRLFVLAPASRTLTAYAPAYHSPGGEEPYIALAGGCFDQSAVYALRLRPPKGVVAIARSGAVRQLARLSEPGLIDGIAYDGTGKFSGRLLVTVNNGSHTAVLAIGCRGRVRVLTRTAPRLEGGLAVAPASFGRFAGDLIAPDEKSGRIFAITPSGRASLLLRSKLPHGQDIGVESAGFVPSGARFALVADRLTPGNRHPGDGAILRLDLSRSGARRGDLLVATEGGARTLVLGCDAHGCGGGDIAAGPRRAHLEGHIAFGGG